MSTVVLNINISGITNVTKRLDPKLVDRSILLALNRTAKNAKTRASTMIRNDRGFKIKKMDLDKRLDLILAKAGSSTKMEATLLARRISAATGGRTGRDSFSLTYFGFKETRKTKSAGVIIKGRGKKGELKVKRQKSTKALGGVSGQIIKGGPVTRIVGAFIAQMASGHIGVFVNVGKHSASVLKKTPGATKKDRIKERRVVSVASMFKGIRNKLKAHVKKQFRKEYVSQLRRFHKKFK